MNYFEESENLLLFQTKETGISVRNFLKQQDFSMRFFRKLYRNKNIYVNGKFKRKDSVLNKGDIISIFIEDEINNMEPQSMNLDIIYEDFDLLVLNKAPNMVVHPTKSHQRDTLSNGVAYYYQQKNIRRKIRFVNRLDMDTTGLLIVAKNPFAHQQLANQLSKDVVQKKYLALVDGIVEKDKGSIDLPIGREGEGSIRKKVIDTGKNALTKYTVKERLNNATLLDVQIITGRSHQIRVHLSHIGHPIIGDVLYGKENSYIDRQALHSHYLKIQNIRTKEPMEFCIPIYDDMGKLLSQLRK